ncbi:recombinase family protein [Methylobacterium sp. J-070]|uniref:recombinase family protein n=1 Tax=Methylobacterium sp. J-070 TaxID=2836650 RepID=UPI001FBBB642|nr:recombinase family protein [Methylobacterium sp. J-070]MCJ2050076.1 recombinase family protein [Methylobacterium sp. J-070]
MGDKIGTDAAPAPATAYSYIRLSSKRQSNTDEKKAYRDGLRRQTALRDEYLAANPHLTLDTKLSLHDIGVSAFTKANMAKGGGGKLALFQQAVDEGRIAKGSYLLVENLDRMTRASVPVAQHMLLGLVNAGIVVVSIADKMTYQHAPDDPVSQAAFLVSVMTLMRAHEESALKSRRLKATWEEKRKNIGTRRLTTKTPGWLHMVDGNLEVHPERGPVVELIMKLLADGWGRDRIARHLNENKVECWGHGRSWHGGTVQKVTDNRALLGEFQPHKLEHVERQGVLVAKRVPVGDPIPNYFPRAVSDELWALARRVANKRRLGRAPNAGGQQGTVITNLFGMVATCGVCMKPMNYRDRGARSTPVLRCSSERAGTCTNAYRIPYYDTEVAILLWLVKLDLTGGAPGELARHEEALRTKVAERDELQVRGEAIVRGIGAGSRFAKAPLAEIETAMQACEAGITDLTGKITALRHGGGREERSAAIEHLSELKRTDAPDEEVFAARMRIRQIIRDTFENMWCYPDGNIEIFTIDGGYHAFRDGYWWNEADRIWVPSVGAMTGIPYRATKAELARRAKWLGQA